MLSPLSYQSPSSTVRVRTKSICDLFRGISWYGPRLVRAHRHLSESVGIVGCDLIRDFAGYHARQVRSHRQLSVSAHIVTLIWSEDSHAVALMLAAPTVLCQSLLVYSSSTLSCLTVHYQNIDISFTDRHVHWDFRTIYGWNEHSLISINCTLIISHRTNKYYIHGLLHVLIVHYRLGIQPCGSRWFPILTIDCVNPVHIYNQDVLLYLWWDSFQLFE